MKLVYIQHITKANFLLGLQIEDGVACNDELIAAVSKIHLEESETSP